ncbi:peptide deformylase [Clostridium sp. A1-XYC3]|uniref:Peptide deformylase n=1 Tax=Clostridium tanneri TaxID=3037988 RepID=A0ABU4JSG1_9CLOT|nr:peptide deformylase [Clostridium sp. A1-XYC3]MDW8800894.1 peptide deformylase [Clostridium sp. A1-XYC3]
MAIKEILLLGNKELYHISEECKFEELDYIKSVIQDLQDTIIGFQKTHGWGRAIAAPQIGVKKRLIYTYIDGKPTVYINPVLIFEDDEKMEVLDDCMSFPDILVDVMRYKRCRVESRNLNWELEVREFEGGMSELIQHEYDHLDGILAVQRARDNKSLKVRVK